MPTSGRIKESIFASREAVDPDVTNKLLGSMTQHSTAVIGSRGGYMQVQDYCNTFFLACVAIS